MKIKDYLDDLQGLLIYAEDIKYKDKRNKIKGNYLTAELAESIIGLCIQLKKYE